MRHCRTVNQGRRCNVSPKPRSQKGSRLTTIPHGGPPALRIGMRSAEREPKSVSFGGTNDRMVRGTRSEGGVFHDLPVRCSNATFRYISHSAVVIPCESPPAVPNGRKRGGREPPQKWGGMWPRQVAFVPCPYLGPMRVALVLIYPCGKARIGAADAPETGTSLVPRIQ